MRTLLVILILMLVGCAETPNPTTTRHQIDDLSDDDRDGVINQRDRCAQTPSNVDVDREGCAEWQTQSKADLVSFFFEMDQSQETNQHQKPLTELLTLLDENPEKKVVLIGDTSPEASIEYNKILAQKRTHTIRDMLIRSGVSPDRISEQEFTQITVYTEQLHSRKRRAIAVVLTDVMTVKPSWNIFSSESELNSNTAAKIDNVEVSNE